ncbi:hypothetical protein J6590_053285 [Homalodisca vitripennis]|nr:hypothetical protein J6590_053285 [Homalodisca vitripennis]
MLIFGDVLIQRITQGTFYEIKNSPVPGFWPDIKPSDIITKRAQLALLLHNNNLSALTPDTAAELMYQVPAPILTHARPESPISKTSTCIKLPKIVHVTRKKNTQEENWSEVKKRMETQKKQKKKVQDLTVIPPSNKYEALNTKEYDTKIKPRKTSISKPTPTGKESEYSGKSMDPWTGRGLPELIGACSKGKIKVSGLVMPGATTEQVYKQAEGALCRPTVIIAGTNNITKKSTGEIYTNLESNLQSLSTQRTVHITTIPYRYDVNTIDPTHNEIDIVNNYIKEIATISLDTAYTSIIKKKLSYMIINFLNQTSKLNKEKSHQKTTTAESENITNGTEIVVNGDSKIKIIESNMTKIILKNRNNKNIAFAHCISGDLNHECHMSSGVATCFSQQFGKPHSLLANYLTHQKSIDGVNVFGLVTKPDFYKKPVACDYDMAFNHLTEEFKKRNLKYLVCSPMGCVRDNIPTEHFATNIVNFQQHTGASIQIIMYNENSKRPLRNGLSFVDFKQNLYSSISSILLKQMEATSTQEILEAATTTSEQYTSKDLREAVPQEHDELHMTDSVDDFPPLLTRPMSKTVFNNHSNLFSNSCIASDISCSKTDENVIPLNQDNDVTPDAPPLNSPQDLVLHPT